MLHDPASKRSSTRTVWFVVPILALACAEGEPIDAAAFGGGTPNPVTVGTTTTSTTLGAGGRTTTGSGGTSTTGSAGSTGMGGSSGGSGGRGTGGSGGGVTGTCTAPMWVAGMAYMTGAKVSLNGKEYTARYYTQGDNPETNHEAENGPVQGKPWTFPTNC